MLPGIQDVTTLEASRCLKDEECLSGNCQWMVGAEQIKQLGFLRALQHTGHFCME